MALPRLFGDVAFRYDPLSDAVIVTSVGGDGANPTSSTNPLPVVNRDSQGRELVQLSSAFGEQAVIELSPQWQQSFEYTVDNTELNSKILVGTGTVTQANAMAVISTGGTAAGQATMRSTHHARYKAGLGGIMRFSARFSTPVALTHQYAGLADEAGTTAEFKNGYTLGIIGTTPTISRFQNDVQFDVPQSSWDDPLDGTGQSKVTLDFTKLNVFYIQFQYLGAGAIYFWTENPLTGVPFRFHNLRYGNSNTVPSTYNPNYHVTYHVDNKTVASNISIYTASYGYFIEGKTELVEFHQPQFSTGSRQKTAVTTEVAIVSIRNKSTYASKTNYIDLLLERFACSIEAGAANNLGSVRIVKNATLGGVPSWADVNTTNSVVELDAAGTTVTGGTTIIEYPLANKNDKVAENVIPYKFIIHPGDTITLAGSSAASATINASVLWKELF